jgi:Fe-Mn family superoxide dismutase
MTYELPNLPYEKDALEPHIDGQTMNIHHDKHHAGYTKKLNAAVEEADEAGYTLHGKKLSEHTAEELLMHINLIPETLVEEIANNAGGYVNHSLFWTVMTDNGGGEPEGALKAAIEENFGSFERFKNEFSDAAKGQFGSGWAWLVVNHEGLLDVISTPNQDSPLMTGLVPILGLDVWEHAYYLHYQNKRPDYVEAFFNVINWDEVNRRYGKAIR